ncbi:MAG: hypothetical protein IPP78_01865 [Holophagaceae bacterium]|nr:hypothetical protein [Holophagaceae bacterium]
MNPNLTPIPKPGTPTGGVAKGEGGLVASGGQRVAQAPEAKVEASAKVLAELVQAQRQLSQVTLELSELKSSLGRRGHQMSVLQHVAEILAATTKATQVADVVSDVMVQEFGSKRCLVWVLEDGGTNFQPRSGFGIAKSEWTELRLPAPNPFPDSPIVLYQCQWLEGNLESPAIEKLKADANTRIFFVPFENQLLVMGFAILALPAGHQWLEEDLDAISILQQLAAVSIYNAWLFRDLSEQRDALQSQTLALEKANTALRDSDRIKSEFLALTSHELRTPLTGILGFTRLVMDGLYTSEADMKQMLQASYSSGKHLLELLNDILDLAKIESGKLEVRCEPMSLYVAVEEVRPIVEAYPRHEGVSLIFPTNLSEIPEVMVDSGRLQQVLLNLLSNALKFTKEGSVEIRVERGPGVAMVHVVDTGIGVSSDAQERLFQKFVQAEGGHAREYGGTGLGLVICKRLMEMMGGTISLASEGQGKGTTMTLTMQIA